MFSYFLAVHSHFFFSLIRLVWYFCFAWVVPHLPEAVCSSQFLFFSFHHSSSFEASGQFHSTHYLPLCLSSSCFSDSFKPTKQGSFLVLPTFFSQILGLVIAAQLPPHHCASLPYTPPHIWICPRLLVLSNPGPLCQSLQALLPLMSLPKWLSTFLHFDILSPFLCVVVLENQSQFYKPFFICLLCPRHWLLQAWEIECDHGSWTQYVPQPSCPRHHFPAVLMTLPTKVLFSRKL